MDYLDRVISIERTENGYLAAKIDTPVGSKYVSWADGQEGVTSMSRFLDKLPEALERAFKMWGDKWQ